jgi:predicted transposase YdaD
MPNLPHDAFDRSLKRFWSIDPLPLLKLALGEKSWQQITPQPVELIETIKQIADGLIRIDDPEGAFFVHIEFESKPDTDLPYRMLSYNNWLWTAQKYIAPVRSVVVLLQAPPDGFSEVVEIWQGPDRLHQFCFKALHLYDMPARLLSSSSELAPLTPLGKSCSEKDIHTAVAAIVQAPAQQQANALAVLYLLGRSKKVAEHQLARIINMEVVKMSDVYQEIVAEGIQLGLQQGELMGQRKIVRSLLEDKYGVDANSLDIEACTYEDLRWLQRECLKVAKVSTLKKHLETRLQARIS